MHNILLDGMIFIRDGQKSVEQRGITWIDMILTAYRTGEIPIA